MRHARQVPLRFFANKLVRLARSQHRQCGAHAGIGLHRVQQADGFLAHACIVIVQQSFHLGIPYMHIIADVTFQRIQ